ncbi:E3 ubiquitin-protein ligase RING1-like [Gossypium australe]|uniref:E3 ubiquitin-protein ligase RING1-like n=1 Tax=Gossypium australe TaxID=47621 RepID=A0A5B6WPW4_9ROSI|nr:E3 ubiquitin-protein ligase RING1-like [Gossypium australe]
MVMKEPKLDILIRLIVWRLHDGGFAINRFPRGIKGGGENREFPMVYMKVGNGFSSRRLP